MKISFIILCTLFTSTAFAGAGGNIGVLDDRTYGSLSDPTYSAIAQFIIKGSGICTAGFIAPNLVITNRHCVAECDPATSCQVKFWNGTKYVKTETTSVAAIGKPGQTFDGQDWAILTTREPNPNFKNVASKSTTGTISRGGFGCLRVIKDSEVQPLKQLFMQTYERYYDGACKTQQDQLGCVWKYFNDAVKNAGFEPLLNDADKFKVQTCHIKGNHPRSSLMLATDCDSAGGDSGAPLLRGDTIVGLNNSGPHMFFSGDESIGSNAVKNENFYTNAKTLISTNGHIPGNGGGNPNTPANMTPNSNIHNGQPPKPATGNGSNAPAPQPNKPVNNPNPTPNEPVANNPEPPTPPASEPPSDNPGGNAITDPAQIRKLLNDEIMQLECD